MPYGRTLLSANQVFPTRVSADGNPLYKAGGVTLLLSTLAAAAGTDTTLPDGSVIKAGFQYLRYGQVLTRITTTEVQTVDLSGGDDPTAGTFDLTILGETIQDVAWNVTAAALQTAIRALPVTYANQVTVTKSGFVYTITFPSNAGNVAAATVDFTALTGATAVTITTTTGGNAGGGKFGPYDPDATDGRATLTRGNCFVLDETYVVNGNGTVLPGSNDIIGGVIEGGGVWRDRLIQSEAATHTLALGPTFAEFVAAFPNITFYKD